MWAEQRQLPSHWQVRPPQATRLQPVEPGTTESYSPPEATPGNAATRRVLGGRPLRPTLNLADYLAQPPLMLTNLRSAMRFLGRWVPDRECVFKNERPSIFRNTSYAAPISTIRVRVKDVTGPDDLSLTRIRVVAQKIHDATGLDVDITAGSSPHPLLVELPAGKFGRPKLLLREGWSKKGVSVSFLRALDRKDVLLFALILVICGFFLSNGALASVRARRAEIGTLRTLGWPARAIFGVVLGELLFVGLLAGILGALLALVLVLSFGLHLALWRVMLVVPLAVGLALVAGLVPALLAGRGHPLDALRPAIAGRGRLRRVRLCGRWRSRISAGWLPDGPWCRRLGRRRCCSDRAGGDREIVRRHACRHPARERDLGAGARHRLRRRRLDHPPRRRLCGGRALPELARTLRRACDAAGAGLE